MILLLSARLCQESTQACAPFLIHPTFGSKVWKASEAAQIDFPLENVLETFEEVKLLRVPSFL